MLQFKIKHWTYLTIQLCTDTIRSYFSATCSENIVPLDGSFHYLSEDDVPVPVECEIIVTCNSEQLDPEPDTPSTSTPTKASTGKCRCNICNELLSKGSLHRHMRKHNGKHLHCSVCPAKFTKN